MAQRVDRKRFWEHKILGWEQGRYQPGEGGGGLLEALADRASASLRFRLRSAGELLTPHVEGASVLDLGAGSGRLAEALMPAGARAYHGVDLAEAAVEAGRARAVAEGWDAVTFERAAVTDLGTRDADVVVSLGLLDWLDDDELEATFAVAPDAHVLHAVAEKQLALTQLIHRSYAWLAYGHRTGSYVPRYYDVAWLGALAGRHLSRPLRVWRHPELTFGAYLTTLPVGDPL